VILIEESPEGPGVSPFGFEHESVERLVV